MSNLAYADDRREDRDEVYHRARAVAPQGTSFPLLIVNISPHGMMARCDATPAPGETIGVILPRIGTWPAEVRWSLGGRIGCQFTRPIALADYYGLLAALLKH